MSFQQINTSCFYYQSSVNIGYVKQGDTGLLIDAGIDRSSVKKVLKELRKRELPLTHLFITHAHADHYGGGAYVQDQYNVHTSAPVFEEAVLRNPALEPLYLFGGNDPLPELKNKFLQGPPLKIDSVVEEGPVSFGEISADVFCLPGHSYQQMAIKINDTLYAADSYFSEETLFKHRIPYITDISKTIESLKRLRTLPFNGSVPGHGVFEKDPSATIQSNLNYHQGLLNWLLEYIKEEGEVSQETIVSSMCKHFDVHAPGLSQWLLYKTAVTAYLLGLMDKGLIEDRFVDYTWVFYVKCQ